MPGQYATNPTANPITVDYLLKNPQVLNRRFTQDLGQKGYISEALLQGGYPVIGGALRYNRDETDNSGGLFPDRESGRRTYEIVAEGARFPLIGPTEPTEQIAKAAKHGLRMFVTWEQQYRNMVPQVDKSLRQLKNELINYVDGLFMTQFKADSVINAAGAFGSVTQRARNVTTVTGYSGTAWNPDNNGFLKDIARAKSEITGLRLGFEPDTILLNDQGAAALMSSSLLLSYFAQAESRSPVFTGQLPGQLWGMDILYSPFVDSGTAYVLQRKAIGGYGDERPESIKPLPFNEEREVTEIKASRVMLYFIDEPKAVIKLTNIGTTNF